MPWVRHSDSTEHHTGSRRRPGSNFRSYGGSSWWPNRSRSTVRERPPLIPSTGTKAAGRRRPGTAHQGHGDVRYLVTVNEAQSVFWLHRDAIKEVQHWNLQDVLDGAELRIGLN